MRRVVALMLALALVCCLAGIASAEGDGGYRLVEESSTVQIGAEPVPLAGGQPCCALHLALMLCALAVTVYYTHDRKARQTRIFELRRASVF